MQATVSALSVSLCTSPVCPISVTLFLIPERLEMLNIKKQGGCVSSRLFCVSSKMAKVFCGAFFKKATFFVCNVEKSLSENREALYVFGFKDTPPSRVAERMKPCRARRCPTDHFTAPNVLRRAETSQSESWEGRSANHFRTRTPLIHV